MVWPSGPMVEGMSGLRKLAKERSEAEAGAQNISSSDCSACGSLALLKARPRGEAVAGPRVFVPRVFSEDEVLLRLVGRSVAGAEVRKVSSSACFARGFLLPVNSRPGKRSQGTTSALSSARLCAIAHFAGLFRASAAPCDLLRFGMQRWSWSHPL